MKALTRALRILDALSAESRALGVTELADRLDEPPSSTHRLLQVLTHVNLVIQDSDSRRYRLGPHILSLADAFARQNPLIDVARPYLASLRTATGEAVFLTELVGQDAVCVATAERDRPLLFYMRVGQRMPFHASAAARAILAFRPLDETKAFLQREALEPFTDSTITTVSKALSSLDWIRHHGYATCEQEMEVGVSAVSAPISNRCCEVFASVTLVAPHQRLIGDLRATVVHLLLNSATEISNALGCQAHRRPKELAT